MPEQNINNEQNTYQIPENDVSNTSDNGLIGKSSVENIITAAAGIDPTRFWIVFMVGLIIALASTIMFGGAYVIKQGENKDAVILDLRKELKECPEKTLIDLKKQTEAIDQLRNSVLYNSSKIDEIKTDTREDIRDLKEVNNKLKTVVTK